MQLQLFIARRPRRAGSQPDECRESGDLPGRARLPRVTLQERSGARSRWYHDRDGGRLPPRARKASGLWVWAQDDPLHAGSTRCVFALRVFSSLRTDATAMAWPTSCRALAAAVTVLGDDCPGITTASDYSVSSPPLLKAAQNIHPRRSVKRHANCLPAMTRAQGPNIGQPPVESMELCCQARRPAV